jgi:hypothetical protein
MLQSRSVHCCWAILFVLISALIFGGYIGGAYYVHLFFMKDTSKDQGTALVPSRNPDQDSFDVRVTGITPAPTADELGAVWYRFNRYALAHASLKL